jgi:hypothetical protein
MNMKKYKKHQVTVEHRLMCICCGEIAKTTDEIIAILTKYNHEHEIAGTVGSVKNGL